MTVMIFYSPPTAAAGRVRRHRRPCLAREHGPGYGSDEPSDRRDGDERDPSAARDPDAGEVGASVRARIAAARELLDEVLATVADPGARDGGELAGLLELLATIDTAQAAAVELTATCQRDGLAERHAGLPLDHLLAFRSRATYGDRRTLTNAAEQLATMPHLRRAVHAGAVGWAELRAVLAEARRLNAEQRARLDAGFADLERLGRLEPDVLVDEARDACARLRPDLDRDRSRRIIEHRYLALQPALDGAGSGYFELDPGAYGPVAEALEAAMPAPSSGPNDVTRDAPGEDGPKGPEEVATPDGDPAFCDHLADRSRARQRADALVRLAETFLAGGAAAGTGTSAGEAVGSGAGAGRRRARPSVQALCDIGHLAGNDRTAVAARALLATAGGRVRLTPDAARRLACDSRLQLVLTDGGEVLGTTEPTEAVPAPVRRALVARDQGCRFPGCSAPVHWTDAHHVRFRRHGGPTTLSNLVLLCRRHHTAVHEGGWRLTMPDDGAVAVRRGRVTHTSDPPLRRPLLPDR